MKLNWLRFIVLLVMGLVTTSCFELKKMYGLTGYHPVQGLPFAGEAVGGYLNVKDTPLGRRYSNLAVEEFDTRVMYTGGIEEGALSKYNLQLGLRPGIDYSDVSLRDVGGDGNDRHVAVGTGGSMFAFGGDECFEAIDPITNENLNTVIYSPDFNKWIAAGDNGTVLESSDRLNWTPVDLGGGLQPNQHFFHSIIYAGGILLISDDQVAELRNFNGNIAVAFAVGFLKSFIGIASFGDFYFVLAIDENSGGFIVLERKANSFNFAPEFGGIFNQVYRDIFTLGRFAYFLRGDVNVVEIRNYDDPQDVTIRQLPGKVEEVKTLGDGIYFSGTNDKHERRVWRANMDFSVIESLTNEPGDQVMKTGQCMNTGS